MTVKSRQGCAAFVATGFLCAACTVGPNYRRPPTTMPSVFKETPSPDSTLAAEWHSAQPSDDVVRAKWWEVFQDPLLNSLEEQVAISSQTVAQAEAQFRAARAAIRTARADLFPTVTAGASATRSRVSATTGSVPVAVGTIVDYQLPIDFSYEADLWGRVRRNVEANVASAQATSADVQTALLSSRADCRGLFRAARARPHIALLRTRLRFRTCIATPKRVSTSVGLVLLAQAQTTRHHAGSGD